MCHFIHVKNTSQLFKLHIVPFKIGFSFSISLFPRFDVDTFDLNIFSAYLSAFDNVSRGIRKGKEEGYS